jgi:photosystem II stability/assembly factor-like uncharacterized protein
VWLTAALVLLALVPPGNAAVSGGPYATEYDSLLVSPTNPSDVLLGTQHGLLATRDGGRTWRRVSLDGYEVAGLVRAGASIVASGKDLLAKSVDGGRTWVRLHPRGLPNNNISAVASDPAHASRVYVVLVGFGLYRSVDNLRSFRPVSFGVGPAIKSLAETPDNILAGDVTSGIYLSSNGRIWRQSAGGMVMGLAFNSDDPREVLAASFGIARSQDGGVRWKMVKRSHAMFGAVAWAPGRPSLAYAVGDDRSFWRSTDSGLHWSRVTS